MWTGLYLSLSYLRLFPVIEVFKENYINGLQAGWLNLDYNKYELEENVFIAHRSNNYNW